jgi:hypothetical protein
VRSTPEDATVLLDGRAAGTTPLDTMLDAGRSYTLRLERGGHLPTQQIDVFAAPDTPLDEVHVLTPLVTRSEADGAQIANVCLAREKPAIRIRYDLDGEPGEEYAVEFTVFDAEADDMAVGDGDLRGAWGKGQRPGLDKQIAWRCFAPLTPERMTSSASRWRSTATGRSSELRAKTVRATGPQALERRTCSSAAAPAPGRRWYCCVRPTRAKMTFSACRCRLMATGQSSEPSKKTVRATGLLFRGQRTCLR